MLTYFLRVVRDWVDFLLLFWSYQLIYEVISNIATGLSIEKKHFDDHLDKILRDGINMLLLRVITQFASFHNVSLGPFHIVKTLASEKTRPAVNGICTFSANVKGNV